MRDKASTSAFAVFVWFATGVSAAGEGETEEFVFASITGVEGMRIGGVGDRETISFRGGG